MSRKEDRRAGMQIERQVLDVAGAGDSEELCEIADERIIRILGRRPGGANDGYTTPRQLAVFSRY